MGDHGSKSKINSKVRNNAYCVEQKLENRFSFENDTKCRNNRNISGLPFHLKPFNLNT